jgi:7-carboxy-7-deazaguanine synthase (Cx14CxxC type)
MTYSVKEMYYTLQGEGAHTGRAAVFLRFAGCNLWSGREEHREQAVCRFCDTQFVGTNGPGGGKFDSAKALAAAVERRWEAGTEGVRPYVVCTGGEPLLQLDESSIVALHAAGFEIGVESNGTIAAPDGIDWLCVSPKGDAKLAQQSGDELKLVFPQVEVGAQPSEFEGLAFRHFYLQPMDGPDLIKNTKLTIDYCKRNPRWNLSVQTHKYLGID